MIVLEGIPCNTEEIRSGLSHDWLGNTLLRLDEEDVVGWHGTPSAAGEEFERRLLPEGLYHEELRRLRVLIDDVQEGYSPALLVQNGPLSRLPENTREAVKSALHRLYLATPLHGADGIEALQHALRDAATAFSVTFDSFCEVWFAQPPALAAAVGSAFQDVLRAGRTLRNALDHLPRGIVLP